MAATIQECIDDIAEDIGGIHVGDVTTQMPDWNNQMFLIPSLFPGPGAPWDRENVNQRSVYNWAVSSILTNAQIQAGGNNQLSANLAIGVVLRALLATQAAVAAGRITAAQRDSVVAIYTVVWE